MSKKIRIGMLGLTLLTGAWMLALLPGCTAEYPSASTYFYRVFTPTATPAVPVVCDVLFNGCETLAENGVWSGTQTVRTLSSSWFTQGTSSLKAQIVTPAAWNDNILILTGFTPTSWQNLKRITLDIFADANVVNGASYSLFQFVVDSDWPVSKYYRVIGTGFPTLVAGQQSVTLNIDFSADTVSPAILPTDPINKITFVYNRSAPGVGQGTGNLYIDNIRFHYCP